MKEYCIVCEVTADLPQKIVDEMELKVIPMHFRLGEHDYLQYPDERELSLDEFYRRLKAGEMSITSQVNPARYKDFFCSLLDEGKDVLYIAFSSGLSGTYNTGRMITEELKEEYPDRKIIIIDSLCASIGQGMLVYLAALEKRKGKTLDEVAEFVEATKKKCCHWFAVEDLYHLKRGGRLTSLEAVVGTALKIKPILSTDEEGKLKVVQKVRGDRRAMDYIVNRLIEDGINASEQTVFLASSAAPEQAEALGRILTEQKLVKDYVICSIGTVIGTHTGAGMYALAFVGENYR